MNSREKTPRKYLKQIGKMYEFNLDVLSYIGGFENEIYSFLRNNREYFLRIGESKHMSYDFVEAEIDWILYLSENDVPVVKPLLSGNGNYLEKVELADGYLNIVVFEKALGEHLLIRDALDWSEEIIREYGRVMGKMHALSKNYEAKESKRYEFTSSLDLQALLKNEEADIKEIITNFFQEIEKLPKNKDSFGLVHGDFHVNNFFAKDNKITAILDFDRSSYKWFISEIAVAMYYQLYFHFFYSNDNKEKQEEFIKRFLPLFLEGYEAENKLDPFWIAKIDIFIKVREAIMFMFFPPGVRDFKKIFPRGREEYRRRVKQRLREDSFINIWEIYKNL